MKRSPIAALTALLAAMLVLGAALAAPALAHDALKSSNPAKDATVKKLDTVKLEFSASVRMPFVIVRGPDGAKYQQGKPEVDGHTVNQAVTDDLPDGKYTIAYRVVSSDGHPIEGEIPFSVKGAPKPTPSASESATTGPTPVGPAPTQESPVAAEAKTEFPVWLLIVVGALVGIGVGFLLSMRKKRP
ncbi:copper resistance protein CopC [Nonomuraea sp. NPDC050556]|uniref:copper resistance CopC family protein n=1 Tax=Nonomuraea sp. NPDC050556 TaxID=3364369 RepID=UPI00379FC724